MSDMPPRSDHTLTPAQVVEVDRLCGRFEEELRGDRHPAIEAFLDQAEAAIRPTLLAELLAVELEYRRSRGEQPEPAGYRARFPDHVAVVEAAFPWEGPMSSTATATPPPTEPGQETPFYSVGTATSEGQRFRVIRPHARGGLGAVFVALDTELHREVALKQILDHHADDLASRTRFLVEAEITGGLEHPGIVPVYGLGTYGGGRPYYAMRFIRGDSLKEAIEQFYTDPTLRTDPGRRTLELSKLLRRFLDVCNAIHYAHSRGVLHRDIKPGNIIVGKHGETLVVDWGLAKPLGQAEPGTEPGENPLRPASASGSAETLPGFALGTPAFMSPEQAAGDLEHLGPPSDVYSLGATFYCLLTGKAPFEGTNVEAMLRDVQRGLFPPPSRRAPGVDRALEAICLKAMARRPADRYATPRALADDIERWLADEPVTAWREPWTRRLRRWARRNRTVVAGLSAVFLTAFVALAVSTVLISLEQAKTERARRQADANFDRANEVVDRMLTAVGRERFDRTPLTIEKARKELVQEALRYKLDFLGQRPTDPKLRREAARSRMHVATIWTMGDQPDQADPAFRQAIAELEALARKFPSDPSHRAALALALYNHSYLLASSNREAEAEAEVRQAIGLQRALVAADRPPSPNREQLINQLANLATLLSNRGGARESAEALGLYREARDIGEALVAENPQAGSPRANLVYVLNALARHLRREGQPAEAIKCCRRALELVTELARIDADKPTYLFEEAKVHSLLGTTLADAHNLAEAEREDRASLKGLEQLCSDFPGTLTYRSELSAVQHNLANLLGYDPAHKTEVETLRRQVLHNLTDMAKRWPNDNEVRQHMASAYNGLGNLLGESNRLAEAEATFLEGLKALGPEQDAAHDTPELRSTRGMLLNNLANQLESQNKNTEAVARLRQAVVHQKAALDANPNRPFYRESLYNHQWCLAAVLLKLHEYRDAADSAAAMPPLFTTRRPDVHFEAAKFLARCAALAQADQALPEAERKTRVRTYGDQAIDALKQAVFQGLDDPKPLRESHAFDAIRDRDAFQALLTSIPAKKPKP